MNKKTSKKPNILYKDINEFNVKLILIVGVIFIMLSGYTSYALFSDTIISGNTISLKVGKKTSEKTFTHKGSCEEYTAPYNGYYKIEAWGAQGGGAKGGKGGYTSGIVQLIKGETLNVCVGGQGQIAAASSTLTSGGFNGGAGSYYSSGTGGGATDIRIVDGAWNNTTGLNSRIMVAAGGGGVGNYTTSQIGGSGGGLLGIAGGDLSSAWPGGGGGATQTSGGAIPSEYTSSGAGKTGSFGTGGAGYAYSESSHGGGGGGSGYYGGAGGSSRDGGGGGGSSFISGYAGVNAITSSSSRTHTNNTLHYSNKYFISGKMEAGANTGNGKAKITYIDKTKPERVNSALNGVRYIKDCMNENSASNYNTWVEIQAIYNGVNVAKGLSGTLYNSNGTTVSEYNSSNRSFTLITDGIIEKDNYVYGATYSGNQCYVIDLGQTYDLDEVAVWHYYSDGRTYYDNYTYVSSNNTDWTLVIDKQEVETSEGKRVNAYEKIEKKYVFTYTGACEEFEVADTGYYKLEAWGAEGGTGYYSSKVANAGKGGYTSGIVKLIKGETIHICVGGKGTNGAMPSSSGSSSKSSGGYNGGGAGYNRYDTNDFGCGGGGGATDIRLTNSSSDNATSLNSRIMVAGGGGSGCLAWNSSDSEYYSYAGGKAGGLIGSNGSAWSGYTFGKGGTQTSGGTGYSTSGFGSGGAGQNATNAAGGGGGSGYYGGGSSGGWGSAGGGSSFISGYAGSNAITSSSNRTHTNDTLHYSNKYFVGGEIKSGIRTGNGLAVITLLDNEPVRTNKALDGVRYIKDCATGNTTNLYKTWMEIQAISDGVNVAKGKTVTGTGTIYSDNSGTTWSYDYVTDGKMDDGKSAHTRSEGNQCVTVDLGQTYDLDEIAVWHWYEDGRTFTDNYTYVSSDNTNWIKVIDREEPETTEGKRVNAYEGANLTIEQSKGGTITCTNNTTNQTSTTLLTVTEGDSITCKVDLSTNYELTSLKIEDTSITNNTAFTYAYKGNTKVTATYYCNDSTGPTITVTNDSNSSWTFGPVKLTVNATDQSGVSSIYYRYDSDSSTTKRNDWSNTSSITDGIQAKGTWSAARDNYVYITATDTLGNESTVSTRVRIKSCSCGYRSSTYKNVPQWYHSADSSYHTTAYLHLCKCSDGSIYNCKSSGWDSAGGSGCYVHTGYNAYTALDYSWSNYSGSYW